MSEPKRGGKKRRTIKSILRKNFNSFLASIENKLVQKAVEENSIITGGSIASMLLGENVSDFDVYFTDLETTAMVARYYVDQFKKNPPPKFAKKYGGSEIPIVVQIDDEAIPRRVKIIVKSAGVASEQGDDDYEYFETDIDPGSTNAADYAEQATAVAQDSVDSTGKPKYRPVFLSSNAISLSDNFQLVTRFYGEPSEIHANYDFAHCTNYWVAKTGELVLRPQAMEALLAKDLQYVGSKYPLCSFIRTRKFIARHWTINAGQYLKMAWQLNELDLSDPKVLEEQLIGVDAAYFDEIIRLLKKRMDETGEKKVDQAYLMELIDRIF